MTVALEQLWGGWGLLRCLSLVGALRGSAVPSLTRGWAKEHIPLFHADEDAAWLLLRGSALAARCPSPSSPPLETSPFTLGLKPAFALSFLHCPVPVLSP